MRFSCTFVLIFAACCAGAQADGTANNQSLAEAAPLDFSQEANGTCPKNFSALPVITWSTYEAKDLGCVPPALFAGLQDEVAAALEAIGNSCAILHGCCRGLQPEQLQAMPPGALRGLRPFCARDLLSPVLGAMSVPALTQVPPDAAGVWNAGQLAGLPPNARAALSNQQLGKLFANGGSEPLCGVFTATVIESFKSSSSLLFVYSQCVRPSRSLWGSEPTRMAIRILCADCQARSHLSSAECRMEPPCVSGSSASGTAAPNWNGWSSWGTRAPWSGHSGFTPGTGTPAEAENRVVFGGVASAMVIGFVACLLVAYAVHTHRIRNRNEWSNATSPTHFADGPGQGRSRSKRRRGKTARQDQPPGHLPTTECSSLVAGYGNVDSFE